MSARKERRHEIVLVVRFDKPCTKGHAIAQVRDCIWGEFYPAQFEDDHPGEFKIAAVKGRQSS